MFGIGLLFYSVIDLGVISTVIYVWPSPRGDGITASPTTGLRFLRERTLAALWTSKKRHAESG